MPPLRGSRRTETPPCATQPSRRTRSRPSARGGRTLRQGSKGPRTALSLSGRCALSCWRGRDAVTGNARQAHRRSCRACLEDLAHTRPLSTTTVAAPVAPGPRCCAVPVTKKAIAPQLLHPWRPVQGVAQGGGARRLLPDLPAPRAPPGVDPGHGSAALLCTPLGPSRAECSAAASCRRGNRTSCVCRPV